MLRPSAIFLALALPLCAEDKTTFDDAVFPIFQQACLNCHNPDKAKGGLDLSSFTAAMKGGSGGKIVEPGDTGSILLGCVMQTSEKKMPPEGEKLSTANIDILKRWIEGGLLENRNSSARKASKPKFETTLRSDPAAKPDGPPPMPVDVLLEPALVTPRPAAIHAIATSPWAPLLAITGQHQILLHDTISLELVGILPFPEGEPVSLAFTPDGRYLIVGGGVPGKSGVTVTFDVTTGTRLLTAAKEFDSVLAADIRPAFDIVATGGPSRLLKIWNTETGTLVRSIKKHTDWITALDLSNDGVLLASGDRNGGVWVWESDSGNEFHTLRAHQLAITAVQFRADSNLLATASEDGTVRFWEMNGGSEVKKIDAHPGGVTAFAFGRDGASVTAGRDMKAKWWKPDFNHARDLIQNLPALPTAVALDFEGKRAFVADARGIVRVLQTEDSKLVGDIAANPPTIAVRLQTLAGDRSKTLTALELAEKSAADRLSARDAAREATNDAEKALQQSIKIHKAAQTGAEQSPDEVHTKLASDALARIPAAEQALMDKKSALEAAEKSSGEAATAASVEKESLVRAEASLKRWTAAAINAKAIAQRREADDFQGTLEDTLLSFTTTSELIAVRSDRLNAKRAEREELARGFKTSVTPEVAAELRATVTALDISIERETAAFHQAEQGALNLRTSVETAAPLARRKDEESLALRDAYHKALQ